MAEFPRFINLVKTKEEFLDVVGFNSPYKGQPFLMTLGIFFAIQPSKVMEDPKSQVNK